MRFIGLFVLISLFLSACDQPAAESTSDQAKESVAMAKPEAKSYAVTKTEDQWKAQLTPLQYKVTRKQGTEPPFKNEYWDNKKDGVYQCIGCDQPLYDAKTKFDSGTGWPSFWAAVDDQSVDQSVDKKLWMVRTELLCSRCGGIWAMSLTTDLRPPVCGIASIQPH